jgi:hypothetical protein
LGGLGRTRTILACYFVKTEELSAKLVITRTRKRRPSSIELAQEGSVVSYTEFVSSASRLSGPRNEREPSALNGKPLASSPPIDNMARR